MNSATSFASRDAKRCDSSAGGTFGPGRSLVVFAALLLSCAFTTRIQAQAGSTWQSVDVGHVAAAGQFAISGNAATVDGSGADIWDGSDAFRFGFVPLTGDGSIVARVASVSNTDVWAKAGVMMRQSLDANSPNVLVAATPAWNGVTAQVREVVADATSQMPGPGVNAPYWVKLTRTADLFVGATSPDGVQWTNFATFRVTMPATLYVGLAVTSHNDGTLCHAAFDNVAVSSSGTTTTPPPTGSGSAQSQDIGTTTSGTTNVSGGTVAIGGSGADIWGTADGFRFYSQPFSGDGTITARVVSMSDTDGWAKAGVMIRESLDPAARNVFVAATPEWHGVVAQVRGTTGGETTQSAGPGANAPYWVRIARSGTTFVAAVSPDGSTWTTIGTFNVAMSTSSYIGLAVTSHHDGAVCNATFDSVLVNSTTTTPPPPPPGTGPTITSVTPPPAYTNGYGVGYPMNFTVTFNADVVVTGTPSIGLTVGTAARQAAYVSTNGNTVLFRYVVVSGDRDIDGIAVTSPINLNGGTIAGTDGSSAALAFTPPDTSNVRVYAAPPPAPRITGTFSTVGAGTVSADGSTGTVVVPDIREYPAYTGVGEPGSRVKLLSVDPDANPGWLDTLDYTVGADGTWRGGCILSSPLQAGKVYSVYYYAEDPRYNRSATQKLSVTINAPAGSPVVSPTTVNGRVGTPITPVQIVATNSPTQFSLDLSGYGLSVSSTGVISGTPTRSDTPAQFLVYAFNSAGFGQNTVTLNIGLSDPWQASDIGSVAIGGSSIEANGGWVLRGAGADIWGAADAFQFAYQPFNGDGSIVAYVPYMSDPDVWSKAGLMFRETLDPGARNVFAALTPHANGIVAQARTAPAGATLSTFGPGVNAPYWLRLTRSGDTFTAAASADGATWTTYATYTVAMSTSVYVGLAVTSHNPGVLCYSQFQQVAITTAAAAAGAPAAPSNLTGNPISNSAVELVWSDNSSNEASFQIERSSTSNGPYNVVGSVAAGTRRFVAGSLLSSSTYYFRVRAIDASAPSDYSNTVRVTTPYDNGPTTAPTLSVTSTTANTVNLGWSQYSVGSSGSYYVWYVERSTDGVVFTPQFSTAAAQPSAADDAVMPSSTYYYRVRSTNGSGNGPYSNIVTVTTPADTVSSDWSFADIGTVGVPGSNTAAGSTLTIQGSGDDVWGSADSFYFVWKTWTGDGVVEAQINSMGNTDFWAKAGVMIRESTDPGARNVFVALTPATAGIVIQGRSTTNGTTTQNTGPTVNAPYWVRIVRRGSDFYTYTSADGSNWQPMAAFTYPMANTACFGFAVTSHNNTQLNQAVFNDPFVGP